MRTSVNAHRGATTATFGKPYELISTPGAGGAALHLEFVRGGDRFSQVLSLADSAGQTTPIWRSVEGAATDAWRPSPPLQNLSIEALPDGRRVALLVGMAESDHWSASIEAPPRQAAFIFDIACRTTQPATMLGSTYQWAAPGDFGLRAHPHRTEIVARVARMAGPWECGWIEARSGCRAAVFAASDDAPTASLLQMVGSATFAIRPRGERNQRTVRWKYRVELLTPDP